MKIEISDDEAPLIERALRHYSAYLKATDRTDTRYEQIAERLNAVGRNKPPPRRRCRKRSGNGSENKGRPLPLFLRYNGIPFFLVATLDEQVELTTALFGSDRNLFVNGKSRLQLLSARTCVQFATDMDTALAGR